MNFTLLRTVVNPSFVLLIQRSHRKSSDLFPTTLNLTTKIDKAGLEAGLPLRPVFQGETLKQHSQCLMTPSLCDGCRWALFTLVRCDCGLWATWVLLSQALLHTLQLPTAFFPSSWGVLVFLASVLRVLAALVSPHSLCSVLSLAVC